MSPRAPQKEPRALACYRCWRGEPAMVGTEFSLLGFCALRAVQNSPCFCILGKNSRYFACWESFVPLGACSAGCGESFVLGRSFSDAVGFTVMTSLCSGRENVRPAREKWPKNRGSWRAGRVFSRKRRLRASAGRTLSRGRMCLVLGECCRVQGTGVFFWVTRR